MKKYFLTILLSLLFTIPVFASLEALNSSGETLYASLYIADWTELQNSSYIAEFGVGNATDSYTNWLLIPDGSAAATVQILSTTYDYSSTAATVLKAVARGGYNGAITNAVVEIEIGIDSTITGPAPTGPAPTVFQERMLVRDVIHDATASAGGAVKWTDTTHSTIPLITYYGIYRFPLYGEKVLRLRFNRSGATTAATYHWCIVRFQPGGRRYP